MNFKQRVRSCNLEEIEGYIREIDGSENDSELAKKLYARIRTIVPDEGSLDAKACEEFLHSYQEKYHPDMSYNFFIDDCQKQGENTWYFITAKTWNEMYRNDFDCDVKHRFYICPKLDKMVPVMNEFVSICEEKGIPYHFKFNVMENCNDRIVIYCANKNVDAVFEVLETVKNNHPEYFEDAGKNPLWGPIDGMEGIYYGAEPTESDYSYGELRSEMAVKYFRLKEEDQTSKKWEEYCLMRNVNPKNIALNMDDEDVLWNNYGGRIEFRVPSKYGTILLTPYELGPNDKGINGKPYKRSKIAFFWKIDDIGERYLLRGAKTIIDADKLGLVFPHEPGEEDYEDSQKLRSKIVKYIERRYRSKKTKEWISIKLANLRQKRRTKRFGKIAEDSLKEIGSGNNLWGDNQIPSEQSPISEIYLGVQGLMEEDEKEVVPPGTKFEGNGKTIKWVGEKPSDPPPSDPGDDFGDL